MKSGFSLSFILKACAIGVLLALLVLYLFPQQITTPDNSQPLSDTPIVQINQALDTPAHTAAQNDGPASYATAVNRASPSVVNIYTARTVQNRNSRFSDPLFEHFFGNPFFSQPQSRVETGTGSGVLVSADGHILTNYHVIKEAQEARVLLSDGRSFPAKYVGADPDTDLAVLKIDAPDVTSITFSQPENLLVGDVVLAIGNPFGIGQTVTMGIVSATGRDRLGLNIFENFIQTDAAINPGNSGGALVNSHGELIGINTAIFSKSGGSQGIGFAIPVSMAKDVLTQIIEYGQVIRGWLGVEGLNIPENIRKARDLHGVFINGVYRNGPADQAGILPGDVITDINDQKINEVRHITRLIGSQKPGAKLKIRAIRNGEVFETEATLIQNPNPSQNR